MARVRATPPLTLGGRSVTEVIDLETGWRGLAPTEGLIWGLEHGGRVVVRPSGTEPKLKAYVEVVMPRDGSLHESRRRGQFLLDAIREDVVGLLAL